MADIERVTASSGDGTTTVIGKGSLDLYVAEQFKQAISEAVASGKEVIVDIRQASFIDTAIVVALAVPAKKMLERGSRLRVIVADGAHPQYVLNIVGFTDIMDIVAEQLDSQQ